MKTGMKVLIVDDELINLKLLRAVLEGDNIEVVEAQDGTEALNMLGHHPVDAIISDILMPRMDGYRLCQEVRKSERWRNLPFIFYSATYTSENDEKLCYDLGGDRYLRKPSPAPLLLATLTELTATEERRWPIRTLLSEPEVTKEYSERLVCKLEQKNQELALRTEQLEKAQAELEQANRDLDRRVQQRTAELELANQELESFSYTVSHDLRSPLNHITGYIDLVLRGSAGQLDEANLKNLETVRTAARRMADLISALLDLSRLARAEVHFRTVDLSALATEVIGELQFSEPKRTVEVDIAPGLKGDGDPRLLRIVLTNLLGNAWKYSRKQPDARIQMGRIVRAEGDVFFVRDNGAGFDMAYVNRLFQPFQRLHGVYEFEGNGIGLATVRRILTRHNGKIWAESFDRKGATFYFTLNGGDANGECKGNPS
jgi:signal transduction histidine kinase